MGSSLYFAYGSNLKKAEMHSTAPHARAVGIARLDGFKLTFDKHSNKWNGDAANIIPDAGSSVWGFVYDLDDNDLAALRRREGGYHEARLNGLIFQQGKERAISLLTFIADDQCDRNCGPAREYLATVINGAIERNLPKNYISRLRATPVRN